MAKAITRTPDMVAKVISQMKDMVVKVISQMKDMLQIQDVLVTCHGVDACLEEEKLCEGVQEVISLVITSADQIAGTKIVFKVVTRDILVTGVVARGKVSKYW